MIKLAQRVENREIMRKEAGVGSLTEGNAQIHLPFNKPNISQQIRRKFFDMQDYVERSENIGESA